MCIKNFRLRYGDPSHTFYLILWCLRNIINLSDRYFCDSSRMSFRWGICLILGTNRVGDL